MNSQQQMSMAQGMDYDDDMEQDYDQEMEGEYPQEQEGMQEEEMNARLMAVVGVVDTALDKYINTKIDYISCYNKLAEVQGTEPMDTGKLQECYLWKDTMMAQVMELLGAEYQEDPMMLQGMSQPMMSQGY
jgi:hypothetical protein